AGQLLCLAPRDVSGQARRVVRLAREGGIRGLEAARGLLHPHRRGPFLEALRDRRRHGVRHVPHQAHRRGHRPGIVLLCSPRARAHEDPVLLSEDRRGPAGSGRTAPEAPFLTPREAARAIWNAALAAGDVRGLVGRALQRESRHLAGAERVLVLGCGKAGAAMARAAEDVLGGRIAGGFVGVEDGYTPPTRRVAIAEAGHPVPEARGEAAAARLLAPARHAASGERLLFLVSGGGSALTPAPTPPVTLAEKQEVTRLLLASGATINELNAVRKHISRFKGGQLARAAAPAPILTLALSDVIGDPLDVIASGPTAPDPTTFADALGILDARKIRGQAPTSVVQRLEAGARGEIAETPKPGDPLFRSVTNVVIGNDELVVRA